MLALSGLPFARRFSSTKGTSSAMSSAVKGRVVENLQHVIHARLGGVERHTPGVVRKIDRDIDDTFGSAR